MHVGVPTHMAAPSRLHVIEANRAAKAMGIRLLRVPTVARHTPNQRYVFRFPNHRAHDTAAINIGESVLYGFAISFGPFGDPLSPEPVYPFPASLLKRGKPLDLRALIAFEEAKPRGLRTLDFPAPALKSVSFIPDDVVAAAWKASRVLFRNPRYRQAARFLKASQDAFFVWPGQIDEILSNTSLEPRHGAEQTAAEDALINAFKVIEALIGDPPRDDRKLKMKLRAIGVDPDEPMGYHAARPLYHFIRDMNLARDRKSAHGSTANRIVTITDMFEYQLCARYLLVVALETTLGEPLFPVHRRRRTSK